MVSDGSCIDRIVVYIPQHIAIQDMETPEKKSTITDTLCSDVTTIHYPGLLL